MASNKNKKTEKEVNIVHQNAIWRETIKKEETDRSLHSEFSINPHRLGKMHSVTDKPNRRLDREETMKFSVEDPAFLKLIDHAAMEPHKKYSMPMTEAQEYGWFHQPLIDVDSSDNRLRKPRKNSEITKYMDEAWRLKEQTENLQ